MSSAKPPQSTVLMAAQPVPTNWLFSAERIAATPSRVAGVEVEREARYRRSGAEFIKRVGIGMKM